MCPNNQSHTRKWGYHYTSFVAIYALLITHHYKQKKILWNESRSLSKIWDKNQWEATSCYHRSTPCIVSEKNWNTKEDKCKSMISALHILQLAKRPYVTISYKCNSWYTANNFQSISIIEEKLGYLIWSLISITTTSHFYTVCKLWWIEEESLRHSV